MTPEEQEIVEALGDIFNKIVALPEVHPSDVPEAQMHIHALQNIILARPTLETWRKKL